MSALRIVSWSVAVLAVLAGGYWVFSPATIAVETAVVATGEFVAAIEEDGRTRIRDRFTIAAPLSGRLTRISLRPGDTVEQDQVVAVLQPALPPLRDPRTRRELEERVGAAEASLEEAISTHERLKLALAKAQTDYARARQLRERGVISQAQLERDRFTFEAAERDATAAERRRHAAVHVLAEARTALQLTADTDTRVAERLNITATVAGHVLRVHQESEGVVNAGAPLMEIGDPANIEVIVDVLTTDAVRIAPGADARIERWGGDAPLRGKVRRVEPSGFTKISALGVEEQRVWTIIDIISPPESWRALADAFRVEVNVVVERITDATIAPAASLFRRGNDWFVFVVSDLRAKARRVEVLRRSGRSVAILSGITSGDRVIVYPPASLSEGARVREVRQVYFRNDTTY
jgi:HlyD family secretion protein